MVMQPWMPQGALGGTTQGPAPTPTGGYQFPTSPGIPQPTAQPTTGSDAELQRLVTLINRYHAVLGFQTTFTLAEAREKGLSYTQSRLKNLESAITREGGPLTIGRVSTEEDVAQEVLEAIEGEMGIILPEEEGGDDEFAPLPGFQQEYYDERGYLWRWDGIQYVQAGYDPAKATDAGAGVGEGPSGPSIEDDYGRKAYWTGSTYDYPPYWQIDPVTQEPGYQPAGTEPQWRPGELELKQQQIEQQQAYQLSQQQQAEREYGASLRAQGPGSWLEYAAYTGQQPAVQPWMLPLMPQQYSNLQAGQPIPGWQGGVSQGAPQISQGAPSLAQWGGSPTGQVGDWTKVPAVEIQARGGPFPQTGESADAYYARVNTWAAGAGVTAGAAQQQTSGAMYQQLSDIGWSPAALAQHYPELSAQPTQTAQTAQTTQPSGLPTLTRPSRQYQARIGPTALQQYYGYQQAQTGATPQETDWRLWSTAPPGGRYQGLSYTR